MSKQPHNSNAETFPMTFEQSFVKSLTSIPWFSQCGKPMEEDLPEEDLPFVKIRVTSWKEAKEQCSTIEWENTTLEARNDLTAFLYQHLREHPQEWNEITRQAKAEIIMPLTEMHWLPYAAKKGLGKTFIDCVQWDVLTACMENSYRSFIGLPHFFSDLLCIYKVGHFPCGWSSGEYPNGKLLVW